MTTSRTGSAWTSDASNLSKKQVGYYRFRLRNKIHQLVIEQYLKLEAGGLTKAEIARRIKKRPEQVTRLLGAPGNWTIDTVSDLLLAMGSELALSIALVEGERESLSPSNFRVLDNILVMNPIKLSKQAEAASAARLSSENQINTGMLGSIEQQPCKYGNLGMAA